MTTPESEAIPVVSDRSDPLLEGIMTDRDLCCSVIARAKSAVSEMTEMMTRCKHFPVPRRHIQNCARELMLKNQVRQIPDSTSPEGTSGLCLRPTWRFVPLDANRAAVEVSKPLKRLQPLHFREGALSIVGRSGIDG